MYNNASTVERSIDSLKQLMPYKMFVVDNYSTDGTFEKFKKYKQVVAIQQKCTLGKGRNLAMGMALKEAMPDDPMFTMDLDNELTQVAIKDILIRIKKMKNNTFYWIGCLGKASAHAKVSWKDLFCGEEVEHSAHAISLGIEMHYFDAKTFYSYVNDLGANPDLSLAQRQLRYTKGFIGKGIRLYKCLISLERGYAYKSPKEFIAVSLNKKNDGTPRSTSSLKKGKLHILTYYLAYTSAFLIAKLLGIYNYDKKLNNHDYIKSSSLSIKEIPVTA